MSKLKQKSNKQIIEYQTALLKHRQVEIDSLKQENDLIAKSLSFQLGLFITYPLRFVANLFSKKNSLTNPIEATCDSVVSSPNQLEIHGWAISDNKIKVVEVYLSEKYVGKARLGVHREDLKKVFPENPVSANCGFYFCLHEDIGADTVLLKIYDSDDNFVEIEKIVIPAISAMTLNAQYHIFLQKNRVLNKQLQHLINDCDDFQYKPLISIIVAVFEIEPKWLNLTIESVLKQYYQNWQLCLYDDGSGSKQTTKCLGAWEHVDKRIQIQYGEKNQGVSFASNAAIKMAQGEYIGLLNQGDMLSEDALYQVVRALNKNMSLDLIYSDEDKLDEEGTYCDPHFKSDFNLATLLSFNYIGHFSIIRKSIGNTVDWFRTGYEPCHSYDLFLRICQQKKNISHIPKVLYHQRKLEDSSTNIAKKKALVNYLTVNNCNATVENGLFANSFRVRQNIIGEPLVSIIIPFKNKYKLLHQCIDSIINKTDYQNYEIILVNNQSDDPKVQEYCKKLTTQFDNIYLYDFDYSFNYAKLNNWAASKTSGELLLFLNNDTEVINENWLSAMLEQVQCDNVVAVGAMLLFPDNSIQHAGVIVSSGGATHINKYLTKSDVGYFGRSSHIQNVSACTAACLMVRKTVFFEVSGFDEEQFKIAYNDIDLCLKIREAGYLITYTPYAKLYHYESKSRGLDDTPEKINQHNSELYNYQQKWGDKYKNGDPYFNPNLKSLTEKISLNI